MTHTVTLTEQQIRCIRNTMFERANFWFRESGRTDDTYDRESLQRISKQCNDLRDLMETFVGKIADDYN